MSSRTRRFARRSAGSREHALLKVVARHEGQSIIRPGAGRGEVWRRFAAISPASRRPVNRCRLKTAEPNITAVAEACGVLRNVFYTRTGVKRLLAGDCASARLRCRNRPAVLARAERRRWRSKTAASSSAQSSNWPT